MERDKLKKRKKMRIEQIRVCSIEFHLTARCGFLGINT
jgi:hypothetical protein